MTQFAKNENVAEHTSLSSSAAKPGNPFDAFDYMLEQDQGRRKRTQTGTKQSIMHKEKEEERRRVFTWIQKGSCVCLTTQDRLSSLVSNPSFYEFVQSKKFRTISTTAQKTKRALPWPGEEDIRR